MELCSELRHFHEPMGTAGFNMVRHPLVFSVPYLDCPEENERLNKMLEVKKEARLDARTKKIWPSYVFLHERPYRIEALLSIIDMVEKKKDRWELIRAVFVDTENLADNLDDWRNLLADGIGRDIWRTKKDLPKSLRIYRGGHPEQGVSWTTSLEKAKWFAKRWGRALPVFTGIVAKKNVIGFLPDRGEDEIVVFHEYVNELEEITGP